MDTTFVRKDFYIDPPKADAKPEEWTEWLKRDNAKAIAAKRAFTKAQSREDMPEAFQGTSIRKVGGVWKQSTSIGVVGGGEEGQGHLEPIVAATQENDTDIARWDRKARCMQNHGKGNEKRKARRARRKAKIAAKKGGI